MLTQWYDRPKTHMIQFVNKILSRHNLAIAIVEEAYFKFTIFSLSIIPYKTIFVEIFV